MQGSPPAQPSLPNPTLPQCQAAPSRAAVEHTTIGVRGLVVEVDVETLLENRAAKVAATAHAEY